MIKSKSRLCILVFIVLSLLSGCANKGTLGQSMSGENNPSSTAEIEFLPITSVRENFDKDSSELKSRTFDNISFSNSYFSFTDASEFYTFDYKITSYDISADNAYSYMCKKLDELFPEKFNDEEKLKEIRFYDVGKKNKTDEFPTLEEYKNLADKNYPYILSNHPTTGVNSKNEKSKECYLRVSNGIVSDFDNGILARRCDFTRGLGSFDVLNNFPVIFRTENLESEKTFRLIDVDISIADAVKSAEKILCDFELSERELPFELKIQNVNVLDIGGDCCAFYFGIVPEYKGVKYNSMLPDDTVFGFSTIDDNTNEREICGEFIMCESDKICRFKFLNPASSYDIIEGEQTISIVSLSNAAQIVSEYLSGSMELDALSVSAVYKPFSDVKFGQEMDNENYEKRDITVKPCWRFVLKPLTGDTKRLYYIFVDMHTGEAYRTVQQVVSGVSYE